MVSEAMPVSTVEAVDKELNRLERVGK